MIQNNIETYKKFAFVILHYMALDATIECVNSIFQCLGNTRYEIVIVDNGSSNSTGELIKEMYSDQKNVHCLLLEENIGFAKGNNFGFRYAKLELHCNFICMLNNDTILSQNSFITKCYEIYMQHPYAVIGPKIIRKDNTVQPIIKTIRSKNYYKFYKNFLYVQLIFSHIGINTEKLIELTLRFLKKKKLPVSAENDLDYNNTQENIRLHGCCWIFTPQFVNLFDGINDNTFLYREEELLYLLLKKHNLKSLYTPELTIYHMEDIATDMVLNTPKKKREFIYRNEINSLKIVIDELH